MKSKENNTQNISTNLLLRIGTQNGAGDSFFYSESWQILRRFVLCFLFTLSVSPLWMIAFNLEVNILQQGLTIFASYLLIYLIICFSKVISGLALMLLSLAIIGAFAPGLPLLGTLGKAFRLIFELLYNRLSYGLGFEIELMEAGFIATTGFVVVLSLLVSLILLWRPLPILAFLFSSLLFGFAEEITDHAGVNEMQLAYMGSIMVLLLIWTFGESKHKLAFRSAKRLGNRSNTNEHGRRKRAVPISISILAVLMLLNSLIPASAFYVKKFDDNMSRLFGKRYQEPSSIPYLQFSLKDLGYYPQENRLGGTPQLLDETYMYLDTDPRSIHLRGTAYYEYTGLGWTIDGMNPNWLMGHPRNAAEQEQVLGPLHKSDEALVLQIMPDRSFELRPVRNQQVVFHGGRPGEFVSLDSSSFNVYFNQSGNLYLDRRISQDGYRGLGQWFAVRELHDAETLEAMIGLFPESQMSGQDRSRWLNLPQLPTLRPVLQDLHPVLEELVYGSGFSDVERVTSIRSYLADSFTYNLNVETPPGDRDFVTYFLETGEGYCTYFATTLTVLLRSAGIPARYVEGFLVPQSKTGTTRELRGENGHAWAEVWFDGLGWVPIDASPSSTLDQMDNTAEEDPREETVPTEVKTEPTETIAPTEVIPKEEPTQAEKPPKETEESSSFLNVLLSIIKLLFYILLYSSPIWLYILWRWWVYKQRHKPEYLQKKLAEGSTGDLISKIDLDLQAMWRLETNIRNHGETIREFVGRMNIKRKSKIDQVYLDLTERIYYDDPDRQIIASEDLAAFLSFYEKEEKRLKEDLPRNKWITKRFLWSDYHPLPR